MEKKPEAFRTIREVAEVMELPQHVVRFWESRFPQIRPLKGPEDGATTGLTTSSGCA